MSDEMKRIGTQMANVMFNMAQMEGERISRRSVEIMDGLRRKWDEAVRATPSPSTAPIAEDERAAFEAVFPKAKEYRWGNEYADDYGLLYKGFHAALASKPAAQLAVQFENLQRVHDIVVAESTNDLIWSASAKTVPDVKAMVDRFLGWKLPQNFHPDAGISFDRAYAEKWGGYPQGYPIGTNLLTADQAKAMFEYVLDVASKPPAREAAERQSIEDDEKFWALVAAWVNSRGTVRDHLAKRALIAHIDTWGGAAPATGNTEPEE